MPRARATKPTDASTDGLYYRPSGEVTVAALGAGLFGGLAAGLVMAFSYAYLIIYIPLVYAHVLCTLGYAAALGFTLGGLLKSGKMRNPAVGVFVAAAVAFLSYYFCWAVWLSAMVGRADADISTLMLVTHPAALLDLILIVNEKGAWSIGQSHIPFTGVWLWLVWGSEALVVLVMPTVLAWLALTSDPFCEFCNEWCGEDRALVSLAGVASREELRRIFESKEFERLKSVGVKKSGDAQWYSLELHHCEGCARTNTLTVKFEKLVYDEKKTLRPQTVTFVKQLLLSPAEVEELRRVSRELTSAAPRGAHAHTHTHAPQVPAAQV